MFSKSKTLIRFFATVLLIPYIIFILFTYLENNVPHARFWATVVGIGNFMLFFSSPDHKISKAIKKLSFFNWISIIGLSVFGFICMPDNKLIIRLIKGLCLLVGFIGAITSQSRFMDWIRRKLWKSANPKSGEGFR